MHPYTRIEMASHNGYYTRDLVTTSGRVEDLQVPRDREGRFHTQVFER
jgi:transposase-like protein